MDASAAPRNQVFAMIANSRAVCIASCVPNPSCATAETGCPNVPRLHARIHGIREFRVRHRDTGDVRPKVDQAESEAILIDLQMNASSFRVHFMKTKAVLSDIWCIMRERQS